MLGGIHSVLDISSFIANHTIGVQADSQPEATFFVSRKGNNDWSGKLAEPNSDKTDGPFASIAKARDAIRQMKADGLSEPVTVMVRGGKYYLEETIVFSPEDSGTKDCPITYTAYPGETPLISGGKRIFASWDFHTGDETEPGILVCTLDDVKDGKWFFRQLFVDDERQTRARIPDEGEYLIEEGIDKTAFKYKEGDFKCWENLNDVEVVFFHSWNETRFIVSELDEENRIVKFRDLNARHPIGWGGAGGANRYYMENVFEGLQNVGDWYLDKDTGKLYYYSIYCPIEELEIVAPVLGELMRFEGGEKDRHIQYINVRGITFAHTDWPLPENGYPDCGDVGDIVQPSAITMENVRHCAFEDNCIKHVGTYAFELTGDGNQINGNTIYDTGGGGIIVRNYDDECNVIAYNHIHHCGSVYPSAVGINIDDGGGVVRHNLIHNIAHSGIYTRHWATANQTIERENQEQGLIIEYNEIYEVMERINDGGGLFVRDSNIIIRNNLIHDVYSYSTRCPGWGIYLGCETRDTVVEDNVVYRSRETIHVWYYDRNIVMKNNIFLDGEISQINYQNPKELSHENVTLTRNIICYSGADSLLFRLSGERSLPIYSDYNLYFHTGGGELKSSGAPEHDTIAKWQAKGFDTNSIIADPMFVDPENDDYSLRPESPVFRLGFRPIDLSNVGLRGKK